MNNDQGDSVRPIDTINKTLHRRYKAEKRFKLYGILAIFLSLSFLLLLFVTIIGNGYSAFQQTLVQLEISFDPDFIDTENMVSSNFPGLVKKTLRKEFPHVKSRR